MIENFPRLIYYIIIYAVTSCILIILVYDGTKELCIGKQKNTLKKLIFGIFYSIFVAAIIFFTAYTINKDYNLIQEIIPIRNLESKSCTIINDNWGNKLSTSEKHLTSKLIAEICFTDSGEIIQYYDIDGELKNYSPTQENINQRDYIFEAHWDIKNTIKAHLITGLYFILLPIIIFILSYLINSKFLRKEIKFK